MVWLGILGGIYLGQKRRGGNITMLQATFKGALKFLVVLLVLYLFGLHLVAMLVLPVLLFINWRRLRTASPRVSLVTIVALAAMAVVVPLSYLTFPNVASEPETRNSVHQVRKQLEILAADDGRDSALDPFAYNMFAVPILNVIVQSFGTFYYPPKDTGENRLQLLAAGDKYFARSRGPDGKFEASFAEPYDRLTTGSEHETAALQYDPTNGIISRGDIIVLR